MALDMLTFYLTPLESHVNRDIISIDASETIQTATETLGINNVGCLIVTDKANDRFGILSERDIVKEYAMERYEFDEAKVGDLMTVAPITISINSCVGEALELMIHHHFRHLPVTDEDNELIGIVSMRDLAHAIVQHLPSRKELQNHAKKASSTKKKK